MTEMYYLQETIGGYRQLAKASGTYDEMWSMYESLGFPAGYAVVSEDDYDVDWL